jgi:DNA-binding transcriptional ArsR family regulator
MTETKDLPNEDRYLIFQVLSHPARVKILALLEGNDLTFSSLKQELRMESSGQLQHHLQKMSGLISVESNGSYLLTWVGKRALSIYRESEKSGSSLENLCCQPPRNEMALDHQISRTGTILRLSIGSVLSALTLAVVGSYFLSGHDYLAFVIGSYHISLGIGDVILFGFFGASFLISAVTGYPGCEITAIPNLFTSKKWYCSCVMTPFNVPNGRLLQRNGKSGRIN